MFDKFPLCAVFMQDLTSSSMRTFSAAKVEKNVGSRGVELLSMGILGTVFLR